MIDESRDPADQRDDQEESSRHGQREAVVVEPHVEEDLRQQTQGEEDQHHAKHVRAGVQGAGPASPQNRAGTDSEQG